MSSLACIASHAARRLGLGTAVLLTALAAAPVRADDYAEVNRLLRAGQAAEALNKAEAYLASKPRDAQMRFLKGVILAETGKTAEAISLFSKLTEEFPELPEPYNNLAVLYAAQSQFDKARAALEMAIRTNPSYATAHENLGDVYAKLASQAYSKALQLDSSNTAVPPKLALIRSLFTSQAAPQATPQTTASGTPSRPSSAALAAAAPAAAAPTSAASGAAASAPTKPAAGAPVVADPAANEVADAVAQWAKAWASKDMDAYLSAYSARFTPEGQRSRKAWEQERRERITTKGRITVDISDLDIRVEGERALAVFRQRYQSGSLVSTTRKTLQLAKENGRWLITREFSGR